ncbi:tetratricopeptide repeat protein [Kitasatospora cathayae]|uniref:Tetratricopeptide repeat protein n=1 Tax=Kitasatospora cathayae TaxID=3004092 RepID=A0ABY7Q1T4_9ACTN|nr:tetratricopeptide repeat protein [Kitasatospora sp. HUAS 3-15]WBP86121.1 tetratricopeptide repeat protein [Kitasatospora sp. HUAS 3-15]
MVDPLSISAVSGVLGAVSSSMAGEAGKWAWEAFGGLVQRATGRQILAPAGATEREAVARLLVEGARNDPAQARALAAWMSGVPSGLPFGNSSGHPGDPGGADAVPRLLPASTRYFTDRKGPLAALDKEGGRKPDGRPRQALLHGPDGIGTSAVAIHWGSREAARFPDGQLYADLRAAGPQDAADPATVLRRFLHRLGVPAEHVPATVEDRADLFGALLATRRLLVVLDHAHSAAQLRPLLTSAAGVFTVITARRPLAGLDAVNIPVGPLADKDARRLLTEVAGKHAVTAARAALPGVLERCAGYPFALRTAAPGLAEAALAGPGAALAGPGGVGRPADPAEAAAEDRYRRLPPDAALAYRRCSLRPWPGLTARVAAAATGLAEPDAAAALTELADAGLLETAVDGRYHYRPVVRRHAEALAVREDGLAACAAAVTRTVETLLRLAVAADYTALPQRWHLGPLYAVLGPNGHPDEAQALAALGAELPNLVEAVRTAEEFAAPELVCQLVEALWAVQLKAGRHDELLPALRAGARAATAAGTAPRVAGRMHGQLALALVELQEYREAERHLLLAAEAEEKDGHLRGQATAVESLGLLRLRQWRYAEALDCFDGALGLLGGVGPEGDGSADLPRARALLSRHRGRALRGLGRFDQARAALEEAVAFFRGTGEGYNTARALTDLAQALIEQGHGARALPLLDEAGTLLERQGARFHLAPLAVLRSLCVNGTV